MIEQEKVREGVTVLGIMSKLDNLPVKLLLAVSQRPGETCLVS